MDGALLELEVGQLAAGGGCVARGPDGKVVFVRHSLPGERVRARVTASTTSFLRADAVEILRPSPDRVGAPCPHAGPGRCGGCDFQHVTLEAQRRLKASLVVEQLSRVAGLGPVPVVVVEAVPGDRDGLAWRNRVRLAVDDEGGVGFRRHRSHEMELVDHCPIASAAVTDTGALAARWPGAAEIEVAAGSADGDTVTMVTPRGRAAPPLPDAGGRVVVRGKGRQLGGAVRAIVGGRAYRVSPGVFWQVHVGAAEALLGAVLDLIGDCRGATAVDLYAGAGLFSVPLAEAVGPSGSVLAIERDARACADARHNASGLPALRVLRRDVTAGVVASMLGHPDFVILDPAREGAGTAVMRALATHAPTLHRLVYVSCDPASFARDGRVLLEEGWQLVALRAFDIFPMTQHVELVAAFEPPATPSLR